MEKYTSGGGWEVISGFDEAYLWPWLVNVFSGMKVSKVNSNRTIATTIHGISPEKRELISEFAEWMNFRLKYIEISLPSNLPINDHFTPMTYSRLVLAEQMEDNFIWMDVDTLLRSGWDSLLRLPKIPPGFISRAVPEFSTSLQEDINNQAVQKAGTSYFNSGIMQIDPNAFRENGLGEKWKTLAKEYNQRHFRYVDQCILNYMLAGVNIPLPKEFNFVPSFWGIKQQQAPSVIHFAGKRKPWHVPKIERNPVFDRFRVHRIDTEYFRLYWDIERELLNEATLFSYEFSKKLGLLRKSQIRPMEISIKRVASRFQ